jgi:hypothetical protein
VPDDPLIGTPRPHRRAQGGAKLRRFSAAPRGAARSHAQRSEHGEDGEHGLALRPPSTPLRSRAPSEPSPPPPARPRYRYRYRYRFRFRFRYRFRSRSRFRSRARSRSRFCYRYPAEVRACLDVAEALGYVGTVDAALRDTLDRIIANLHRLSRTLRWAGVATPDGVRPFRYPARSRNGSLRV